MLAEFQSRKAQRILLRDRDILKYLLILIIIVVGYMVTWTVVSLDHVNPESQSNLVETRHVTGSNMSLAYCTLGLWHYVIEIGLSTNMLQCALRSEYAVQILLPVCGTVILLNNIEQIVVRYIQSQ